MSANRRCILWRRASGLTLVELMVALVMGLILLGGLATVFLANKQTYRHQDALARLQENGRFALALMERDIRAAGAGQTLDAELVGNTVIPSTAPNNDCSYTSDDFFPRVIDGFDFGGTQRQELLEYLAAGDHPPVEGTDVIRVTQGVELGVNIKKDAAGGAASDPGNPNVPMQVTSGCHLLKPGMVVFAVDRLGTSSARFVISNVPNCDTTTGEGLFQHAGGLEPDGSPVKNCDHKLGPADYTGGYLVGSETVVYYVGDTGRGVPALYRSSNYGLPEEVVEGVEDMQIRYGVGSAASRAVTSYVVGANTDKSADKVWESAAAGDADVNWENVRAVRLQLRLRSAERTLAQANPVDFQAADFTPWPGQTYTDGSWRQVYNTTITLRNRVP